MCQIKHSYNFSISPQSILPADENWRFSSLATKFAEDLRKSSPQLIPIENSVNKLQVFSIENKDWFRCFDGIYTESDKIDLVMRPHSLDIWNFILQEQVDRKFAVIGSPGIGKSFGLYYLLKRLMERKATIVLDKKKAGASFAFIPVENHNGFQYEAYESSAFMPDGNSRILWNDPDMWYLIDPAKAETWSGPRDVSAKTVLASSPDPRHLGEWKKNEKFSPVYMKAGDLNELKAAGTFLCRDQGILNQLEQRYFNVGGIPRQLFDNQQYHRALKQQNAVNLSLVESAFLNDICEETQEKESKSISAFFTLTPIESENDWIARGFLSPFKKYSDYNAKFVSKRAAELIGAKFLEIFMNRLELRNAADGSSIGRKYEECAIALAQRGGTFRAVQLEKNEYQRDKLEILKDKVTQIQCRFKMPSDISDKQFLLKIASAENRIYTTSWKSFYENTAKLANLTTYNQEYPKCNPRVIISLESLNQPSADFADAANRFSNDF
jgi:hypothetical protein